MLCLYITWLLVAPQGDSAHVLRHARRAQAEFERARRARLPIVLARSGAGSQCDERIGRFCYWHDASEKDPPIEPASIGQARERLIRELDSAAGALPGDEWIAGQRVRYLAEGGRTHEALDAARSCQAARWWCAALEGFARHAAHDYVGADSVYEVALRDMPAAERCRWTDVSLLLEEPLRRRYRRLGCGNRGDFEARLWWLAQPLLSQPGNDRRTEHFARVTMARMLEHAVSPYGFTGGDDLTELTVRYGWPVAWAQGATGSSMATERVVVGHEREPSYPSLPDASTLGDSPPGRASAQTLAAERPRERYAPAYAATFTTLEPRFAVFRRGESTLVVAVYDLTRDTLFRGLAPDAALALARDESTAPVVERRVEAEPAGVLVAAAPWEPRLVSLELTARAPRRAARARAWQRSATPLAHVVSVSDLLVFQPPDSLPQDLEAVLPHVRASAEVRRGSRIGLYWEVYGLAASGQPLATSVSVVPERIGWLRRVAQSVGLASRPRLVRVEWQEEGKPRDGVAGRALVLDLSTLAPGRYRIELAVAPTGQDAATAFRGVRVVER